MNCPLCGRYGSDDESTGYGGPDICPSCDREGWTFRLVDGQREYLNERWVTQYQAAKTDPRNGPTEDEECPI